MSKKLTAILVEKWPVRNEHGEAVSFEAGDRFELGDVTLLGRESVCDIRTDRPYVSRVHACIRRKGNRYSIEDLGSKNKIRIADALLGTTKALLGRAGDDYELHDWDHIVLGFNQSEGAVYQFIIEKKEDE